MKYRYGVLNKVRDPEMYKVNREKNINSVYLAVSYGKGINVKTDYIFMNEIRELVGSNGEREAVSVT